MIQVESLSFINDEGEMYKVALEATKPLILRFRPLSKDGYDCYNEDAFYRLEGHDLRGLIEKIAEDYRIEIDTAEEIVMKFL